MKDTHNPYHFSVRLAAVLLTLTGGLNYAGAADEVRLLPDSLPTSYSTMLDSTAPDAGGDTWWQTFGDATLSRLVTLALNNNYSSKAMLKRIEASREILRQTQAGYYPTVGLSAGYDIGRQSGRESDPMTSVPTISFFQLGASVSWEIDVFGRIREKAKGDKATIEATRYEYAGMQLSLAAQVATEYFALRMYERQLQTASGHLEMQEEVLRIVEARYKAGIVSKLDVAQARSMVSSTRLIIPTLESEIVTARNALAVLCAAKSKDISAMTSGDSNPVIVAPASIGVPADLIRRRPDIAEAEMRIEALAAQLGVARKEYLPSLSLNASIGTSSHGVDGLFGKNSMSYEVAPTLSWTLFDGFSRKAAVAEAKAQMEAGIDDYNNALATAVQEVENALSGYEAARKRLDLYDEMLATSKELVSLSLERYRQGLADFSDVADAQITYLSNQTSCESSQAACLESLVTLYKALGGGFSY